MGWALLGIAAFVVLWAAGSFWHIRWNSTLFYHAAAGRPYGDPSGTVKRYRSHRFKSDDGKWRHLHDFIGVIVDGAFYFDYDVVNGDVFYAEPVDSDRKALSKVAPGDIVVVGDRGDRTLGCVRVTGNDGRVLTVDCMRDDGGVDDSGDMDGHADKEIDPAMVRGILRYTMVRVASADCDDDD